MQSLTELAGATEFSNQTGPITTAEAHKGEIDRSQSHGSLDDFIIYCSKLKLLPFSLLLDDAEHFA